MLFKLQKPTLFGKKRQKRKLETNGMIIRFTNKRFLSKGEVTKQLQLERQAKLNAEKRQRYWREKFEAKYIEMENDKTVERVNCRCYSTIIRPWQTRTHCCGHIVADTNVSPRLPARATFVADTNFVSGTQKMFLILFRNILCPQQMFPSLRSPRNIMGNNVSATICPRCEVY